jgi:hypothetical protein
MNEFQHRVPKQVRILGGWATLTKKYNAGLSLTLKRNNWGCARSRAFLEVACRPPKPFDSAGYPTHHVLCDELDSCDLG